jgi:hypothetical protein
VVDRLGLLRVRVHVEAVGVRSSLTDVLSFPSHVQGVFTLRDMYGQFQNVLKMGPLNKVGMRSQRRARTSLLT